MTGKLVYYLCWTFTNREIKMIELYHAATSTCSQKVRMCLFEKNISWISRPLNLAGEQQRPMLPSVVGRASYEESKGGGAPPTRVSVARVLASKPRVTLAFPSTKGKSALRLAKVPSVKPVTSSKPRNQELDQTVRIPG